MSAPADSVHAIQQLKARYCAAADRAAGDPDGARAAMAALFVAETTADYGMGPLEGADAIASFLATAIAGNSEWMIHMLHSPLVVVDGDRATGDWTIMVHSKRRGDGRRDVIVGRYSDTFRRTEDGWRIASVRFDRLE